MTANVLIGTSQVSDVRIQAGIRLRLRHFKRVVSIIKQETMGARQ